MKTIQKIAVGVLILIFAGWVTWQSADAVQSTLDSYKIEQIFSQLKEIKQDIKDIKRLLE